MSARTEAMLDLWAQGVTAKEIAARFQAGRGVVTNVIVRARDRGDARALRRPTRVKRTSEGETMQAVEMAVVPAARVDFDWTDERITELTALWASGLSTREIALKFGEGCTKNAIIGKARRLKLEKRKSGFEVGHEYARAVNGERPVRVRLVAPKPRKNVAPPVDFRTPKKKAEERLAPRPVRLAPHAPDAVVIPMTQRVHILDLENHHCKAVIGDPKDLTYCGGKRVGSESWCLVHLRLVYQPEWVAKLRNKGRFVGVE